MQLANQADGIIFLYQDRFTSLVTIAEMRFRDQELR